MMEILTIGTDLIIAFLSMWILLKLRGYGGLIGESLTKVGYGTVLLGFSQVFETYRLDFLMSDAPILEMTHHVIYIIGLLMIASGYKRLMEGK